MGALWRTKLNKKLTRFVNDLFTFLAANAAMPMETDSLSPIRSLLADIHHAARQARESIDNGQLVDLSDLEKMTGLLCAKALDLPSPSRTQAREALATLREPMERLCQTLADRISA